MGARAKRPPGPPAARPSSPAAVPARNAIVIEIARTEDGSDPFTITTEGDVRPSELTHFLGAAHAVAQQSAQLRIGPPAQEQP